MNDPMIKKLSSDQTRPDLLQQAGLGAPDNKTIRHPSHHRYIYDIYIYIYECNAYDIYTYECNACDI